MFGVELKHVRVERIELIAKWGAKLHDAVGEALAVSLLWNQAVRVEHNGRHWNINPDDVVRGIYETTEEKADAEDEPK